MKRKLLFIFLIMFFITPFTVNADTYYFNYSDYIYSFEPLENSESIEVEEIVDNNGVITYKYRTRDYISFPGVLYINSRKFDIYDYIDTNIAINEFEVQENFDLKTMNHCKSSAVITYQDFFVLIPVYIEIENFINIPGEIIVKDYDFNLYNYIETDIENLNLIEIEGIYDLNINGTYELILRYNNIQENTIIVVDIEENNKKDLSDSSIIELDKSEEIINETSKTYETKNYINNYYELENEESSEDNITKIVPINNRIICEHEDSIEQYYFYITYVFYFIIVILLSIIVVRKK